MGLRLISCSLYFLYFLEFSRTGTRVMSDLDDGPIVRVEASVLRLPIFALAVRGSANLDGFEYRRRVRKGDRAVDSIVRTERDEASSYPGPLSRRVHMAFLSMVSDRGFPFEGPVSWSWRDLCRRMDLRASGRRDGELKAAIRATWGLKIFGLAATSLAGRERERETWRRLYAEVEFLNEPREDGAVSSANRLWLAPWYVESLNAFHAAPVDYSLWKRLDGIGPLASRLYEYLIPAFYKRESLELAYDRLASAMPVVAEARRSHAIRQFAPSLAALAEESLIAGFAWDAMKGTGRPKLILDRGKRLAPPVAAEAGGPAAPPAPAIDPDAPKRMAAEFYRLMGKPGTNPLRSDLAIAAALIVRLGGDRASALLVPSVRRMKARFRNAETMGAVVRYIDEIAREETRTQGEQTFQDAQNAEKKAEDARSRRDDDLLKARWDATSEEDKKILRARVLADHPSWKRFPALVEAQCVSRLEEGGREKA